MKRSFPLAVIAGLLAALAIAPTTASAADAKETMGFLGIPLNSDIASTIPECEASSKHPANLCRASTNNPNVYEVRGLPYLPISPGYKAFVTTVEGLASQILLTGNTNSFYLVKDMLVSNFGYEFTRTNKIVVLNTGANYEIEDLQWSTDDVMIDFNRDPVDLSKYTIKLSPISTQSVSSNEVTIETEPDTFE